MAQQVQLNRHDARTLLLYKFLQHRTATKATGNICSAIGPSTVSYATTKNWFRKFQNGDFTLVDNPIPGRTPELNDDELLKLIEENPRQSSRQLAETLSTSHTTVQHHLHKLGKTWKYGQWIPHELTRYKIEVTNLKP